MCDFYECREPATKILSSDGKPFGKLCDDHMLEVEQKMVDGEWNLLVDRHVHTILTLVERDPIEDVIGPGFIPLAKPDGLVN